MPDFHEGWYGSLGKEAHTVPRAELHGLLKTAMYTRGDVKLVMGCLLVVDQYKGGRRRRPEGPNADLWEELKEALRQRTVKMESSWPRANVEAQDVLSCIVGMKGVLGNEMADCLARRGAEAATTPSGLNFARVLATPGQRQGLAHRQRHALLAQGHHSGVLWCRRGGMWASTKLEKLAEVCRGAGAVIW